MSTLAKIGVFAIFLVALIAWFLVANVVTQRMLKAMARSGRSFLWLSAAANFVMILGVFLFLWLLSGFFDYRFIALLLAGQLLSLVLTGLFWTTLGSRQSNWGALVLWEAFCVDQRHPWSKWVDQAAAFAAGLSFPIAAGWVYFSNVVPSPHATLRLFQVTIVALFLVGTVSSLKSVMLILSSSTIDNGARDHVLVVQLGGSAVWALLFSMILWAFGADTPAAAPTAYSIPLNLSPTVIGALVALILLAYVAPYLIGVQRGGALRRSFDRQIEQVLREVTEVLKLPRPPAAKAAALAALQSRLEGYAVEIRSEFPHLGSADRLESVDAQSGEENLRLVKDAYDRTHRQDPCLRHLDYLTKIHGEFGEIRQLLDADKGTLPDAALADCAEVFEARLEHLRESDALRGGTRLAVWLATALVFLSSAVVSELGKLIWARLLVTAPVKTFGL